MNRYMPASTEEIFTYLASFVNFERSRKQTIREYRIDRMRALLEHFDNPQDTMQTIHIAGSKGKGSTALYMARGLTMSGYKTGLYCSPHVSDYRERISAAGDFFPDDLYIREGRRIISELKELRKLAFQGDSEPTAFELFTLLAFLVFRAGGCSMAVIETGIGGRLDATNVISPLAVLITPVELEHTDLLGTTIEEVAAEKAGIIKPGLPVFAAAQRYEGARKVLEDRTEIQNGSFYYLPEEVSFLRTHASESGTDTVFRWSGPAEEGGLLPAEKITLHLRMLGSVQGENAALSLLALKVLNSLGMLAFDREYWQDIYTHLSNSWLPGRMEIVQSSPPVVLDGAHTPVSITRTMETFRQVFGEDGICIFGSVEGKDTAGMADIVGSRIRDIIISTPGSFKPNDPKKVFDIFHTYGSGVLFEPEPGKALGTALSLSGGTRPVLVTGSFYMVAEIRGIIKKSEAL